MTKTKTTKTTTPTTPELIDPHDNAALARQTWDAWTALQRRAATMIKGCKTPAGLLALARVLALTEEMRSNIVYWVKQAKTGAIRRWDRLGLPGVLDDGGVSDAAEDDLPTHTVSGADGVHTEAGEQ
jgi:hypothetical protein